MNYWLIFLTGLTSGGITCASMQAGLLTSAIANNKSKELKAKSPSTDPHTFDIADWGPVTAFLSSKLLVHTVFGSIMGLLGSSLTFSLELKLFFQGFAAFFMLATAANLLEIHPIFRYLNFSPPRFVRRLIKNNQATQSLFAPAILGLLTIFIPCGVTQAMTVLAINSGNPVEGALIMASFVAGTIPIFVLIGIATAKFSELWRTHFLRLAAFILIGMGLYSINGILTTLDSPLAAHRIGLTIVRLLPPYNTSTSRNVLSQTDIQKITIQINNNGYTPNYIQVRAGYPVELTLKNNDVYTCAAAFTFRAFNINTYLKPNTSQVFHFTPMQKGVYTFSCSMGMYHGTMEVI